MKFDVVIAGGGFAGAYCARTLSRAWGAGAGKRVGLIADQNILVFQPMLAEVAGAALSPLSVVNPLREFCGNTNVLRGKIRDIHLEERRLVLDAGVYTSNISVHFEHLVIALGGVVDLSRVPGMPEHGLILKNVGDALNLRRTLIHRLEEANLSDDPAVVRRLLTFVVVGGGYSGVETAGQILDLVADVKGLYQNLAGHESRVVLIHSGPFLLPDIGEPLGRYAEDQLRKRGLEIRLNSRVTAMTATKAVLEGGECIETCSVVSTVGNAPNPLVTALAKRHGLETAKGRLVTDPTMRVKGQSNLWAAGDCAAIPLGDQPSSPPTAQFALRQGTQLARNLERVFSGEELRPFQFTNLGQLASIGHRTAVADVLGFQFSGFLAWWFWRTVYMAKLPGWERKIQVIAAWTLDLFFRRDISLIVPDYSRRLPEAHLEAGDSLFHPGDPACSIYLIKAGTVEIRDREVTVRTLKQGDVLADPSWANEAGWRYSAIATEPSTVVFLHSEVRETLSQFTPSFRLLFQQTGLGANSDGTPPTP